MQAFINENMQYVDINKTLIQLTRLRISLEQEMKLEVEHD